MLQPFEDLGLAGDTFHGRDINIGIGQFAVHLGVRDEDLMQARVADFPDEQLGKILADPIRDALKANFGWHGVCPGGKPISLVGDGVPRWFYAAAVFSFR